MTDTPEKPKLTELRVIVDNSEAAPPAEKMGAPPPDTPGKRTARKLPKDCPVTPLGMLGTLRFYLDEALQLIALSAKDHSRLNLQAMFGTQTPLLRQNWPRRNNQGLVTGWKPEEAAEDLMAACAHLGIWDPAERERGGGAHLGDAGELVLHCGDLVYVGPHPKTGVQVSGAALMAPERWLKPGLIGRYVYPACEKGARPSNETLRGGPGGPAQKLLEILQTWNWRRGELDALLMLGFICAAIIAGALAWRPMIWISGTKGTGKTTVIDFLTLLLAGDLLRVSDTTAAGIWQALGHATLPVAFDEAEPSEDNRRVTRIIELMRQASSGGLILRGGAEHTATRFTVRSSFICSSILIPPLRAQDKSRITVLELQELQLNAPRPVFLEQGLNELGAAIRRRMLDGWAKLPGRLESYRAALMQAGHNARGADQLGTLLACADLALHDHDFNSDDAAPWVEKLKAEALAAEDDEVSDEERCLQRLLTSIVMPWGGGKPVEIAQLVRMAAARGAGGDPVLCNAALSRYGLKVGSHKGRKVLLVANDHQGLGQLFVGSHWAGASGAAGVWIQALRRLPNAERTDAVWIGNRKTRATAVPIDLAAPIMPAEELMKPPEDASNA
jgi:hypothetical protein